MTAKNKKSMNGIATGTSNALLITPGQQKVLSKNQQLFNKLTTSIEKLEKEITRQEEKLSITLEIYNRDIHPLILENARARLNIAAALDEASGKYKFSKKQLKDIEQMIIMLFDEALQSIEPNEEQEALYDKWSSVSYKQELEMHRDDTMDNFRDYIKHVFGMDINLDGYDGSPESFARVQQQVNDFMQQNNSEQHSNQHFSSSKSKKQRAREEATRVDEELKSKNIRSVYIALAKVLHPDSEPDETLKKEKEEVMKKVTVAYEQGDLTTLLRLEMEWVHMTTEHLEKLTDDKLKVYIEVLKEQVDNLQREKMELLSAPRYTEIYNYILLTEKQALSALKSDKEYLKQVLDVKNAMASYISKTSSKKDIASIVSEYHES